MREHLRRALRWLRSRRRPARPTETDVVQMGLYADGEPLVLPDELFTGLPRHSPLAYEAMARIWAEEASRIGRQSRIEVWGIDSKIGPDLRPWPGKSDLTELDHSHPLELEARHDLPDD